MKTELRDRVLWFDGTNQVQPDRVPELILSGLHPNKIVVTQLNEDIVEFNNLSDFQIATNKLKNEQLDMSWQIPEKYALLNLEEYVKQQLFAVLPLDAVDNGQLQQAYIKRAKDELQEIQFRGIEMLFKTLIYIVDTFKQSGTVWGVGRGSSCASLVLFVIGLHKVDPIKYNIPMSEFFHD